jgi:hypothetical protein
VVVLAISLSNEAMPYWWGNNPDAVDRCFPTSDLPPNALN